MVQDKGNRIHFAKIILDRSRSDRWAGTWGTPGVPTGTDGNGVGKASTRKAYCALAGVDLSWDRGDGLSHLVEGATNPNWGRFV